MSHCSAEVIQSACQPGSDESVKRSSHFFKFWLSGAAVLTWHRLSDSAAGLQTVQQSQKKKTLHLWNLPKT